MKIQCKIKHDAIIFDGSIKKLKAFMKKHKCELLKVLHLSIEDIYTVYYIDSCQEPQMNEIKKGYYVWFDELNILNYATKEYINENYEIIRR